MCRMEEKKYHTLLLYLLPISTKRWKWQNFVELTQITKAIHIDQSIWFLYYIFNLQVKVPSPPPTSHPSAWKGMKSKLCSSWPVLLQTIHVSLQEGGCTTSPTYTLFLTNQTGNSIQCQIVAWHHEKRGWLLWNHHIIHVHKLLKKPMLPTWHCSLRLVYDMVSLPYSKEELSFPTWKSNLQFQLKKC